MALFVAFTDTAFSQKVKEPNHNNSDWSKDYEPFRIVGNVYYVGTYHLASYLITSNKGNILINTGLASSAVQIKKNIESLGFRYKDIKILLTTQAHYDHMGAMAAIKKQTGAKFYVNAGDKQTAESGGKEDYEMGKYGATFKPIKADKILHDGDTITLGDVALQILNHPGHTQGSCSYLLTAKDSSRSFKVFIANMPSIITDRKFEEIKTYPSIAKDYAYTLKAMKEVSFDIWVASHGSQFDLHEKRKPGDAYNPSIFMDKKEYFAYLEELKKDYEEKLKKDADK